jgi:hypothetical protein
METILQRMVWNTRSWQMPSGATNEKGFPSDTGFGHEEWNFQRRDAFREHVYGYTYLKPALPRIASSNGQFRIVFFTIHPDTKDRLAVGVYHAAQLIPDARYVELLRYFRNSGILQRRAQELEQVIGRIGSRDPLTEVTDSIQKNYLSV